MVGSALSVGLGGALGTVEGAALRADLTQSVDQAVSGTAGAGGTVPCSIGTAGWSSRFTTASQGVEEVSVGAFVGGGAGETVPVGSGRAGGADSDVALVESALAGA